jgi:hypothetical protein
LLAELEHPAKPQKGMSAPSIMYLSVGNEAYSQV